MKSKRAALKAADLVALGALIGCFVMIAIGENGGFKTMIYLIVGWYLRGLAGWPARRETRLRLGED